MSYWKMNLSVADGASGIQRLLLKKELTALPTDSELSTVSLRSFPGLLSPV